MWETPGRHLDHGDSCHSKLCFHVEKNVAKFLLWSFVLYIKSTRMNHPSKSVPLKEVCLLVVFALHCIVEPRIIQNCPQSWKHIIPNMLTSDSFYSCRYEFGIWRQPKSQLEPSFISRLLTAIHRTKQFWVNRGPIIAIKSLLSPSYAPGKTTFLLKKKENSVKQIPLFLCLF